MEGLLDDLGQLLGEPVSRAEVIGRGQVATVYSLYDSQNRTFPVVAKAYPVAGVAQNEMNKLLLLSRHSWVRVPAVHSVYCPTRTSLYKEILLLERLPGITVSAPCRSTDRSQALSEHIVDCLLSWHRVDSQGFTGISGNLKEQGWTEWYTRYQVQLWNQLEAFTDCDYAERVILYRSLEKTSRLFSEFDDTCVLVHGDFRLRNLLKDVKTDQLLAVLDPGEIQAAPREYDLMHLCDDPFAEKVLSTYLKRAPVAEQFAARRWLYKVWDEVAAGLRCGKMNHERLAAYSQNLIPWLE